MNLINTQTTTVSVQLCYINPITHHPVRPRNVLPWIAQTGAVWVLMRFCAMNLINIQTNNCFSTAALYKSNPAPPGWPRECASLGCPNSCRLGVNEILCYDLINIQTTVQLRYINPIAHHPVRPGNVLPWVAETVLVWGVMRFCAMNLINIKTTTVSVQLRYINPIPHHPVRASLGCPNSCRLGVNEIHPNHNCLSTAALYKPNPVPPRPPRECASLGCPNSCGLGVN